MKKNVDYPAPSVANILIVDDRVDDLRALALLLEAPDCKIVTAASGAEGLKHLLRTDFAVILLDMLMPGMSGLELAALVRGRERSCQTPIIFLTAAHDDAASIYRAYTLGAVDYLVKPPDEAVLRAKITVFVDLYRKEQRIRQQAEMLAQAAKREQEMRLAEERLLSEKRYRSLVEMVPACVVQMDSAGSVRYANRAFHAQSGIAAGELDADEPGGHICRHIHPADESRFMRDWERGLAEAASFRSELRLRTASGDPRWHLCEFVPERAEDGSVRGWLAFFSDCEELKRAIGARDEFLAIASHELRNPLMPMRNSVFILKRAKPGSEQASRSLAVIERQIDHLCHLVDDLLDVTRVACGKVQLQRERLDVAELARRTAEDHRAGFDTAGISLSVSIPGKAIWVNADPTRIAQSIDNLLGNALKFTPRGGRVALSVGHVDGLAVIQVEDNGAGISKELLAELFVPFKQGARTIDQSRGGLGLGLALVKGLLELHGGSVSACSDGPGKGATFVLRLPVTDSAEQHATAVPVVRKKGQRRRVLLVDDNPDALSSLRDALELLGHQVHVCGDGPGGLSVAQELNPEVVICDIGLPGMDGYEVARQMRCVVPAAVLVAMTGYTSPGDRKRALEAGFSKHVAKPATVEDLERVIAEADAPASERGSTEITSH